MRIDILTLFPEMFAPLTESIIGRATKSGKVEIVVTDIRDYTENKHRKCDDTPFGGGAGMVMKPDVLDAALTAVYRTGPLYYLSPRGPVFTQETAKSWATQSDEMTFLCGRFEGVDERILEKWPFQEISIGDFILSGGEPALIAMLDAVIRLLPSVMGNDDSAREESFSEGLLEYPQYTKPQVWQGRAVPDVLLSGHHANIRKWRLAQSETLTKTRRPDLWTKYLAHQ